MRHVLVLMVSVGTSRRFAPFLIHALYETAVRLGRIKRGDNLLLTDERAADLFGIHRPTMGDYKEIRDVLQYVRDAPPAGWDVERPTSIPTTYGRRGRAAPETAILVRPTAARPKPAPDGSQEPSA